MRPACPACPVSPGCTRYILSSANKDKPNSFTREAHLVTRASALGSRVPLLPWRTHCKAARLPIVLGANSQKQHHNTIVPRHHVSLRHQQHPAAPKREDGNARDPRLGQARPHSSSPRRAPRRRLCLALRLPCHPPRRRRLRPHNEPDTRIVRLHFGPGVPEPAHRAQLRPSLHQSFLPANAGV